MINKKINKKLSPVQIITLSFLLVIVSGTLLLSLPIATVDGDTALIDAFFVATSAVCVTGLTTVNTALNWTFFGRTVLLVLIEVGGMSFMLMTLLFARAMRRKVNFQTRLVLKEALNLDGSGGVFDLGLYVLRFSFTVQLLGAALLLLDFGPRYGFKKGIGYSLFHAISAFCNAGFDLFGDSLESMTNNSFVLLVLSSLIIAGGLGFVVWRDIFNWFKGKKVSLHSRLALTVTGILLAGSFVLFFLLEKNFALLGTELTFFQRLANTFFLSVTPRTAGFTNIPYNQLSHATLIVTMFLMFVGGTSGSTAGGLKTTTFGVLVLYAWASIRGRERTTFKERTISPQIIMRAFGLFFLFILLVSCGVGLLSISETIPKEFGIEYIAFEVFSAFGTVGVTMGLTPDLTNFGKLLIAFLMFVGRVGVYTFLLSVTKKQRDHENYFKYPEESIMVG